jgi:hypothetical protein
MAGDGYEKSRFFTAEAASEWQRYRLGGKG